ncbi:MAG: glycoside hydrolase family 3 C-terminal domain-containing protein, partial [Clostridia bacterium]|nr:glycoside hydrolase family 3 C-terminal domain-containing protein [Clostridia bacterium]
MYDVKKIISKMSLEEKASVLTGKDFWQTKDFRELGIPSLFLADGPHGVRKQAATADHLGLNESIPATCFPTAAAMANGWNTALGEKMGEALGEEAAAQDVGVLLGPGLNMKRNPRCGRNFEYFSEDPYLAGKMAAAYVRGIQKNGVSACVKHFAANNQEINRMAIDSVVDERTLREIYLTAFEIAVKEGGTRSVMTSYNRVNGVYANENEHLLKDLLRGEWGFDGVIVSDWAGSNDRVASVKAGSDLEMPSCLYGIDDVVSAVKSGALDEREVDECVERILELVAFTEKKDNGKGGYFDVKEHNRLARKCAEDSIVLLRNDGVLPLKPHAKIAVIGDFAENPRYQGAGSSIVNPTVVSRYLGVLSDKMTDVPKNKKYRQGVGTVKSAEIPVVETYTEDFYDYDLEVVGYEKGFDRYGKKKPSLIKKAVKLAKSADIVLLFIGLDEVSEAEGLDRKNIKLNENQTDLYRALRTTGKKIVAVLSCGCAVEIGEFADASALVYACLSGQACADAVLNVLVGKVNPSGKLAESFPEKYEDVPTANYFPGKGKTVEYREGPYIGYRYYATASVPVKFPFGFGLSYTAFEYSDLTVTDTGVRFCVKNAGKYDGAEISQLYIGKKDGAIFRPEKELKGFDKTFIKAGESAFINIPFDDKTFRYFNVATGAWEIEGGEYEVYVCASSDDVRLKHKITVTGTTDVLPYAKGRLPSYEAGAIASVADEEFSALLGREIPPSGYEFYKKNRMIMDENCTVSDLRYSRRWVGRAFSFMVRAAISFCRVFGMKTNANTLVMGVLYLPVRGLAKFGSMTR